MTAAGASDPRHDGGLAPFEQVVAEHGPAILRVCRAAVGYQDADDVWSETFLAALRAYPALDPGANVQAWLVTIAKHKAIDHHRKSVRIPLPVDQLPELAHHDAVPDGADEALWSALTSLPPKQREAVSYHHLAGLPYAEVARLLGNSEAAARRAAADGIKTLRSTYPGATP
ncbi:MAG TPA: RNA polymerase sigma factor [Micrococcaceae bacterium]